MVQHEDSLEFNALPIRYIDIIVSRGGGGHLTAGRELMRILDTMPLLINDTPVRLQARLVYPMEEFLYPIDPIHTYSQRTRSGEDLYNYLLRSSWPWSAMMFIYTSCKILLAKHASIVRLFSAYLCSPSRPQPHLVISTIPGLNYGFAAATAQLNIPFLVVPTDLDPRTFLNGFSLEAPPPASSFRLALPRDDETLRTKILSMSSLQEDHLAVVGFPCRKYSSPLRCATRFHTPTVTVVAGSQGGSNLLAYLEAIRAAYTSADAGQPWRIHLCTGRNEKIRQHLHNWLLEQEASVLQPGLFFLDEGLHIHLHGYIDALLALMAESDVLITKTGTCTVMEGVWLATRHSDLPEESSSQQRPYLLLDNTPGSSARFPWEAVNIPLVEGLGIGHAFASFGELTACLPRILARDPETRSAAPLYPFADCEIELPLVVTELLESAAPVHA